MSEHTPGPWYSGGPNTCVRCGAVDPVKAELYEALKEILEWAEKGGPLYPKEHMEQAVAKAEGRE